MKKVVTTLLVILAVMNVLLAAEGNTAIKDTLSELCNQVKSVLGVAMFMMIILAAVVYAVGQIMGAETRARASVWATAMFVGAIMAGVILLIAPTIITTLLSGQQGAEQVIPAQLSC